MLKNKVLFKNKQFTNFMPEQQNRTTFLFLDEKSILNVLVNNDI